MGHIATHYNVYIWKHLGATPRVNGAYTGPLVAALMELTVPFLTSNIHIGYAFARG